MRNCLHLMLVSNQDHPFNGLRTFRFPLGQMQYIDKQCGIYHPHPPPAAESVLMGWQEPMFLSKIDMAAHSSSVFIPIQQLSTATAMPFSASLIPPSEHSSPCIADAQNRLPAGFRLQRGRYGYSFRSVFPSPRTKRPGRVICTEQETHKRQTGYGQEIQA